MTAEAYMAMCKRALDWRPEMQPIMESYAKLVAAEATNYMHDQTIPMKEQGKALKNAMFSVRGRPVHIRAAEQLNKAGYEIIKPPKYDNLKTK